MSAKFRTRGLGKSTATLAAFAAFLSLSHAAEPQRRIRAVMDLLPRAADGHIDTDLTIAALKKTHANAVVLHLGYENQWEDVLRFLPAATKSGVNVFVHMRDARYGVQPNNLKKKPGPEYYWRLPLPYCRDYVRWVTECAKLSLKYPALRGILIDDFEPGVFLRTGGFTPEYIRKVIEAKNSINSKFLFLPGIYLPRAAADFRVLRQVSLAEARKGWNFTIEAEHACAEIPNPAYLAMPSAGGMNDFIASGNEPTASGSYRRLWVNGQEATLKPVASHEQGLVLLKGSLPAVKHGPLRFRYEIARTGGPKWLECFYCPWLFVHGEFVSLKWRITRRSPGCSAVPYARGSLKPYYTLADGVLLFTNAFDLTDPPTEVYEASMKAVRNIVGPGKVLFTNVYGGEPWANSVFPSDRYFEDFARTCVALSDGVTAYWGCLLPYYMGFKAGIYAQPPNDRPQYDFRFHYPGFTGYEVGFFQGIHAELKTPEVVNSAEVHFRIGGSESKRAGRWVVELVSRSGRVRKTSYPWKRLAKLKKLWFEEDGTLWYDFVRDLDGDRGVRVAGPKLLSLLKPGVTVALALRLRADAFRGAPSAPPQVNLYITKPKVVINGKECDLTWRYKAGNALDSFWLRSSEHVRRLFETASD